MIALLVKGGRFAAARAAADRGIPAVFVREIRAPSSFDTVLHVGMQHHSAVAAWFHEDTNTAAPFAIGSLLLLSFTEGKA